MATFDAAVKAGYDDCLEIQQNDKISALKKDPRFAAIAARMRGRAMPQVGRIDISIMEEAQSSWLAFQRGELDLLNVPNTFAPVALPGGKLAPDLAKKGVTLSRILLPAIRYTAFNMRDPVLGGFGKEKLALRRAIAMAYDIDAEVDIIRKGQAVPLAMVIPPGVVGHESRYRSNIKHDVEDANALLDRFGYRKGADGYRLLPDGKPLVLAYASQTDAASREFDELWKKSLDSIGIRMKVIPRARMLTMVTKKLRPLSRVEMPRMSRPMFQRSMLMPGVYMRSVRLA